MIKNDKFKGLGFNEEDARKFSKGFNSGIDGDPIVRKLKSLISSDEFDDLEQRKIKQRALEKIKDRKE